MLKGLVRSKLSLICVHDAYVQCDVLKPYSMSISPIITKLGLTCESHQEVTLSCTTPLNDNEL